MAITRTWVSKSELEKLSAAYNKYVFNKGEEFVGNIWKKGRPLWLSGVTKAPYFKRKAMARKLKLNSVFGFPIKSGKRILAIMEFYSNEKRGPDENERKIVNSVSFQIGQFINQKEFEEERKKTTQQMDALLKNVPSGITLEDDRGRIVFANPKAVEILGYTKAKDLYKVNIKVALDNFEIYDSTDKLVKRGRMISAQKLKRRKEDVQTLLFKDKQTQKERWYNVKATMMSSRTQPFIVKVYHDVTKQLEEQKERELFIGFVSHEFKSPLASIKAYIQLLDRRIKAGKYDQARKYLNSVDEQTDKLVKLINNWLDTTRVRAGMLKLNVSKISYGRITEKVVNQIRLTAKDVDIVLNKKNVAVFADPDRISQVLLNLLSNAVNYSEKSSKIIVNIENKKRSVVTSVRDYGPGISPEGQKKIFKLFGKVDNANNREGMGMGLFISNAIVKAHGGKMWVKSNSGDGSTFFFELPKKKKV